ncbi:MAG: hypothetical protein Q7T16_02645 [Candidatus Burarchaeum sp.]|nr:hypothetical protein [Candidatus Burarchaeum sp.]MDO8339532.1 hypothetical protein [Candidatus Burarchaeum sp.]
MCGQVSVSTNQRTEAVSLQHGVKLIQAFSTRLLQKNAPTERVRLPGDVLAGGKPAIEQYIKENYGTGKLESRNLRAQSYVEKNYDILLLEGFKTAAPQAVLDKWAPIVLEDLRSQGLLRPAPLELVEVKGLNGINLDSTDLSGFKFTRVAAPNATFWRTRAISETTIDGGVFNGIEVSFADWVGVKFINDVNVRDSYFREVFITKEGTSGGDFGCATGVSDGGMRFVKPQPETIRQ